MKKALFLIVTIYLQLHIQAQVPGLIKEQFLDSIVYTANRTEELILESSRSISILTADQINQYNPLSVADLLNKISGIYVVGAGQTQGQIQSIFSRGSNSNQTNILVDGIRITNAFSTDNILDLSELSLNNIERIEIIKGNHSSLFGSSSVGACVNIITKTNLEKKWAGDLQIRTGLYNSNAYHIEPSISLNHSNKHGIGIQITLSEIKTNGISATIDTIQDEQNYKYKNSDRDGYNKVNGGLKLYFKNNKWNSNLQLRLTNQKTELDKGSFRDDDNYYSRSDRSIISYSGQYKINNKMNISLISGYSNLIYSYVDDSSKIDLTGLTDQTYVDGKYSSRNWSNDLQFNFKTQLWNAFAGISFQNESMGFKTYFYSNSFGPFESVVDLYPLKLSTNTISLFGHGKLNGALFYPSLHKLNIDFSLRNSHHSQLGNNLSFEINPSFQINKYSLLFASYSTGFTAPSLYQLYSPDKEFSSGISRGNPFLKPELSQSIEIGMKKKINNLINYSISYYHNISEHTLEYVFLWNPNKEIGTLDYSDYRGDTYLNIGQRINDGIELEINGTVKKPIHYTLNLNLIKGKLKFLNTPIDTQHIPNNTIQIYANGSFIDQRSSQLSLARRPSSLNTMLNFDINKSLSLSTSIQWIGKRNDVVYSYDSGPFGSLAQESLGSYTLVNLGANYQFSKKIKMSFKIDNLLNLKYSEILGYSTRRRGYYLSYSQEF